MNKIETDETSVTIHRIFGASRERVWEAWTDPKQVAQWWGPDGVTNTVEKMNVRPGGIWRFIMHGPDGVDHHNKFVYDEVVESERLVYTHPPNEANGFLGFQVTVTFNEYDNDKTNLTFRMCFESAAEREKLEAFGGTEAANQTLSRLADHLTKGDNSGES
ncbi:SRPBCC family protein [Halocatena marina]|uniref:SRPBCC family protein n=1 Tax=Halocatena marina TaxID=2934937 RepID=A0ABD5YVZ5_9EURY|nr:SRPBCC family protein [Halocatena marina]